jgi:hypothetical protein
VIADVHFRVQCDAECVPISFSMSDHDAADWNDRTLWGYGFSYVFRKSIYSRAQFDRSMDTRQDFAFVTECRRAGIRMGCVPDEHGLVVHIIHNSNTSRAFPNYRLPRFMMSKVFGPDLQKYVARSAPNHVPTAY